jgi:methylated-DNA-[protein]-cysteine S-methyltransferase
MVRSPKNKIVAAETIAKSEAAKTVKVTPFQKSVYDVCKTIPQGNPGNNNSCCSLCLWNAGYVTTYKHIAAALEKPYAFRAVGNALRKNPYAPVVPCHRVVASDRSMGGFYGATQGENIDRKTKMLKEELVEFDKDGRVSVSCIFDPTHLTSLSASSRAASWLRRMLMPAYHES